MALVEKNDIKQIFADQAPSIDKPASFANYPRGWDTSRPNNGKPTIKQFNYLQQRTDQNILWMHQNGAALPYDAAMEYAEGAVVVKDGKLQQKQGAEWVFAANKGYNLDYFVDGKSYPLHARVMLDNGGVVQSTVAGNVKNPNVDMTGWEHVNGLYFEDFGVVADSTDQSIKMQNCLDFAQANGIKCVAFRYAKEYAISNKIWVKPQPIVGATVQQPQVKTIIKFNGAVLRLLSDNQIGVEVSREYVRLENPSFITTKIGCVGIFNGLSYENEDTVPDATIRRSSQFMEVIAPCGQGLDIGIKFKPAKRQGSNVWGAYYHRIYDHSFNSVKIAFYFDASFDNLNATTRTRFFGGSHVRGACTFFCLNAETIEVFGYASEMITQSDSRLPNGEAVGIYFPRTSSNSTMSNGFSKFYGDIENCTNYYDIEAYRVEIDGRFTSATSSNPAKYDAQSWRNGGLRRTNIAAEAISAEKGKSARLKLSRTSDPTSEGGVKAEFLAGEKADGSGFELFGSGDVTDNHLDLNFPKVKIKKIWSAQSPLQITSVAEDQGFSLTYSPYPRIKPIVGAVIDYQTIRFAETWVAPRTETDEVTLGTSNLRFKSLYLSGAVGFFGTNPPTTQRKISGKKSPSTLAEQNAVLDSIVAALVAYGIVGDDRTA